jgi:hypothetical protein
MAAHEPPVPFPSQEVTRPRASAPLEISCAIEQARRPFQKKLLDLDNIVEAVLGSVSWTYVKTKNLNSAGWKQTLTEMKEMWQERLDEVETKAE